MRRAAEQLASTVARAELVFGCPCAAALEVGPTSVKMASRLFSLGVMHARYTAEALNCPARRWGHSHDGAGGASPPCLGPHIGDSESVFAYEEAVS